MKIQTHEMKNCIVNENAKEKISLNDRKVHMYLLRMCALRNENEICNLKINVEKK